MKIGLSVKIDVSKINKDRLFKGEKGTYLDLTTFIDTENAGQYGDHGFIAQSVSKEEREAGVKGEILGNVKVFFTDESDGQGYQTAPQAEPQGQIQQTSTPNPNQAAVDAEFDDEIPF